MSVVWGKFVSALEARGVLFEEIAETSDRRSVILAAEFIDPLDIAMLETEWCARSSVLSSSSSRQGGAAPPGLRGGAKHRKAGSQPAARGGDGASASGDGNKMKRLALDGHVPEQLSTAPEEVQDGVISVALLGALVGTTGHFFVLKHPQHLHPTAAGSSATTSSSFEASSHVPLAMRGAVASALITADAFRWVSQIDTAEFGADSLVNMALGEVISDVVASYVFNVSELAKRARQCSMPLLMVVSEAERIGCHIRCLHNILSSSTGSSSHVSNRAASEQVALQLPSGGPLLNLLHAQYVRHSGNRDEERLLAVLLRRAVRPYLSILRQWVTEGVLNDPFHEFFVVENASLRHASGAEETSSGGAPASQRLSAGVRQFMSSMTSMHQHTGNGGGRGGGDMDGAMGGGGDDVYAEDRRFTLDKAKIPSFLLTQGRVAKMVYYSGKYCCLLREYNGTLPQVDKGNGGDAASAAADDDAWEWSNAEVLHRMVESCYHNSSGAIIQLLRSPSVDLMGHLESLKSYFLHQRGDWLVDFLDTADELLHRSPVQVKAHSIRVLLQSAIAKGRRSDPYHSVIGCSFAETTFPQYIELTLRHNNQPPRGSGRLSTMHIETRRSIELLQLEADLKWPLTYVLHPVALKHMNNVFRLLLWVKVCERSIYRWWGRSVDNPHNGRFRGGGGGVGGSAGQRAAHGLKHQMLQFLRQFQFYAAHFVIEPNWTKLVGRMNAADDILSLSHALDDFFESLEHGLILSNHARFRSLAKILDLIHRFGDLGKVGSGREDDEEMESTCRTFHDNFLKLLAELASPRGEDYPQLIPLLTWVDFSHFYDQRNVYKVQHGAVGSQTTESNAMAAARQQQQQQQQQAQRAAGRDSMGPTSVPPPRTSTR
ncbi:gamma-tubulin complex subunit, putative [Bodo saltans]|uniref:Spindle pole body component n=1 Tax=Bodo saltans TaxID=75058 RepID=A0A0S4J3M1_BODSA|nr:gamma-tubulin complex subunit, putative [Bodo saltans]|eukprot:CUG72456.1 gamma-tubulin complex subunit, putative [Bodo saltans]